MNHKQIAELINQEIKVLKDLELDEKLIDFLSTIASHHNKIADVKDVEVYFTNAQLEMVVYDLAIYISDNSYLLHDLVRSNSINSFGIITACASEKNIKLDFSVKNELGQDLFDVCKLSDNKLFVICMDYYIESDMSNTLKLETQTLESIGDIDPGLIQSLKNISYYINTKTIKKDAGTLVFKSGMIIKHAEKAFNYFLENPILLNRVIENKLINILYLILPLSSTKAIPLNLHFRDDSGNTATELMGKDDNLKLKLASYKSSFENSKDDAIFPTSIGVDQGTIHGAGSGSSESVTYETSHVDSLGQTDSDQTDQII